MNRFEKFYIETKDKLFGYLIKLTGNTEEASDILQETYLRVFERYKDELFKSLLYKIGYNIFIDGKRKSKHQANLEGIEKYEDTSANILSSFLIKEKYNVVIDIIQKLNPSERHLLLLRTSDNLSYKEISDITGLSNDNIKVKIHRTRKKLKSIMKEEGLL